MMDCVRAATLFLKYTTSKLAALRSEACQLVIPIHIIIGALGRWKKKAEKKVNIL